MGKLKKIIKRLVYRIRGEYTVEQLVELGLHVGENFSCLQGTILDPAHCWLIDIGNDVLGIRFPFVVESQIGGRVSLSNQEAAEFLVSRFDQGRDQQLPSIGEQSLQAFQGKHPLRTPFHRDPQDDCVNGRVEQVLRHQRPHTVSPVCHPNAYHGGPDRSPERGKEEPLEQHIAAYISLLDVLDPGDNQSQAENSDKRYQFGPSIEAGNQRSRKEHGQVEGRTHDDVEIKYGREIQIIRVLLLDQRVAHPAVHENLHDHGEYRNQGNRSVHRRVQQARKNNGYDKCDSLRAGSLKKTPQHIAGYGFSFLTHLSDRSPMFSRLISQVFSARLPLFLLHEYITRGSASTDTVLFVLSLPVFYMHLRIFSVPYSV